MGLFDWLPGSRPKRWPSTPAAPAAEVELGDRRADAQAFCLAVCAAQGSRRSYGVRLRPEPDGAVAVDGFAGTQSWHVGYLERHAAARIGQTLFPKRAAVEAQLLSIRIGRGGSIAIRIAVS